MSGWYKQHRNLFDREWAKDSMMVSVYAYLHCIAYVQKGKLHGQIIHRGSCLTSRAAIMEGTGLSEQVVKTRLRKLVEYGEIVMKASNVGTIITVCDYDSYVESDDLFGFELSNEKPNEDPTGNPTKNQPLYIKEDRRKKEDNLISPFSPYENERERRAMVKEIQGQYNKMFDGRLPKYTKLYLTMEMKVAECVRRFGRQSVDMVLEQVSMEPFSLGDNKTGFRASFQFIFEPSEFQKYLERAMLRRQKKTADVQAKDADTARRRTEQEQLPVRQSREEYEAEMRQHAAENPDSMVANIVRQWDENNNKQ